MIRNFSLFCLIIVILSLGALMAGNGNPAPGYPHDTIIIKVAKDNGNPKLCDGGHSLFLRELDGEVQPAWIYITMTDWVQLDNDDDGYYDEDPVDGEDNDGDGLYDEDDLEPGAITTALDCDAWGDNEVSIQIRDTAPEQGKVSVQSWWIRQIGRPEENFAVTTFASQVTCTVDPGEDLTYNTEDDIVTCTPDDWVELAGFNLAADGCVKKVKIGGKNPSKQGGKTPFCDITDGLYVDVATVDTNGDLVVDGNDIPTYVDQFIFSISCWDDPATIDVDESAFCPLSSLVWDVDENDTTAKAKAQIFIAHTGSVSIKSGKITGPSR
jgi:hypothetical protein